MGRDGARYDMLSRLLTRREQLVLMALAAGLIVGTAALFWTRESADGQPSAAPNRPSDAVGTVTAAAPEVSAPVPAAEVPAATPADPPEPVRVPVKVAVRGAVISPGLYEFDPDARVQEALDRAGGSAQTADLSNINLAARLVDGTTLTVPEQPATEPGRGQFGVAYVQPVMNPPEYTISGWRPEAAPASGTAPTAGTAAGGQVDLNTATAAQLEALPGVGPKLAMEIMRYRESGRFSSVDDLENVKGIGPKRLETLRPFITVR